MAKIVRRDVLKLGALGFAASAAAPAPAVAPATAPGPGRFTLAFGSCSKPSLAQPLWAPIDVLRPDAWLWLGDIVYADTENVEHTRALYAEQRRQPGYAVFASTTRVLGIWDDHDYGRNDAGSEYPKRTESQAALLDFLDEPRDSPRRAQAGIYASYLFGSGTERVKVILLDTRYHRERPGPDADTLGPAQWAWLEQELKSSPARVNVVASGYQVLPVEHSYEKWANFPRARQRLLDLVRRTRTPGVVFVSGDRHFAELSRLDDGRGYPLHELTSSGMTHSYLKANEHNRYRVGSLYSKLNFGVVAVDFKEQSVTLAAFGADCAPGILQVLPLARLKNGGS